jgi:uncharacterized Tic20 family protein
MSNSFGSPPDQSTIQGDERLLALFSHLSLFLGGILLPIIFWATNRDKSKFVCFHALQALWFHIAYIAVIFIFIILFVIIFAIWGIGLTALAGASGGMEMPIILIILIIAFYALLFAIIFGAMGYSIYMGIKSYKGELVMYPIIGKKVYRSVYGSV